MAQRDDPFATRWQDWTTWVVTPLGLMVVMASLIALIVAAVTVAGAFTASPSDPQADRGVWAATRAWGEPLGILGVAMLFGVAIVSALWRIRFSMDGRRNAFVEHLPGLVRGSDAGT